MIKLVSIHAIGKQVYIIPQSQLGSISWILTGPAELGNIEDDPESMAQKLLSAFDKCKILDAEPEENYFKTFLKISKIRSNKNLVLISTLISAKLEHPILTLEANIVDSRYKAFVSRKEGIQIKLNVDEENKIKIGETVIKLINEEMALKNGPVNMPTT